MTERRFGGWTALAGLALLLCAATVDARDVKRCGITIAPGQTGKLVRNVSCGHRCASDPRVRCEERAGRTFVCPIGDDPACTAETIVLEKNATLDLNGFALTSAFLQDGVVCSPAARTRCTIKGPGTFNGNRGKAITPNDRDVVLEDLAIRGDYGGFTTAGSITARNVVLQNCGWIPMAAERGVRAQRVGVFGGCILASGKDMTPRRRCCARRAA